MSVDAAGSRQGQDVGALQNCVSIQLPGALKAVIAGCSHQLLLWVGVPAGLL